MFCKKCGKEIDDKAVVCPGCGKAVKEKKSIFKKWWFWLIVAIVVISIASSGGSESSSSGSTSAKTETKVEEAIVYEKVDLKTMFADLEANAMKAEANYQDKYIEVTGTISNFDSDGSYISIQAVGADVWDFNSMQCYIKTDEQKQYLLEKSVDDKVTIKGKVKSIGELLGYTLDIAEVK